MGMLGIAELGRRLARRLFTTAPTGRRPECGISHKTCARLHLEGLEERWVPDSYGWKAPQGETNGNLGQ
jgi:hypothetical protein